QAPQVIESLAAGATPRGLPGGQTRPDKRPGLSSEKCGARTSNGAWVACFRLRLVGVSVSAQGAQILGGRVAGHLAASPDDERGAGLAVAFRNGGRDTRRVAIAQHGHWVQVAEQDSLRSHLLPRLGDRS